MRWFPTWLRGVCNSVHLHLSSAEWGNSGIEADWSKVRLVKSLLTNAARSPNHHLLSWSSRSLFTTKQLLSEYLTLEVPINCHSPNPGVEAFEAVLVRVYIHVSRLTFNLFSVGGWKGKEKSEQRILEIFLTHTFHLAFLQNNFFFF